MTCSASFEVPMVAPISEGRTLLSGRTLGAAGAIILSALFAQAAHATPVYFYDAQVGSSALDFTASGSTTVTDTQSGTTADGGSYSFSVLAGPGTLGDQNGTSLSSTNDIATDVRSNTNFFEDNILITGPTGTTVNYSLNFTLTGSFALSATGYGIASATMYLSDQTRPNLGSLGGSSFLDPRYNYATGLFSGITPGPNISINFAGSIPEGTAQNGSKVSLFLNMATDAGGLTSGLQPLGGGGSLSANIDFFDPLSFPTTGPVFDFFDLAGDPAPGWTANSSDGCIVDNQFRCGPKQPVGVAEPPSLPLFGAGIIGTLFWMRRRRQVNLYRSA